MAPEVIASIIAAATALVAVIVGPFLTIRASKKQMLGPMRQAWINSLRDTVAEYMALIYTGQPQSGVILSPDDAARLAAEKARSDHIQETYRLHAKVCLLINPNEADHKELVRLSTMALSTYQSGRDTAISLRALQEHAQLVLKKEWNVVKK